MSVLKKTVAALGTSALLLAATTTTVTVLSGSVAYAERGGNGRGNGRGNGARSERGQNEAGSRGNDRGRIASEMKGLNAAHANPNAMRNASPNSRPGQLYAYQQSRIDLIEKVRIQDEAYAEYERLAALTQEEIVAEFPDGNYEQALNDAAVDYNAKRQDAVDAQDTNSDSLAILTDGRELSSGALVELHRLLGF